MLILDNKYNIAWKCIHKDKNIGYIFLANSIGYYPIDPSLSKKDVYSLYNTWLYKNVLSSLENDLISIFKDNIYPIQDNHKISLLSKNEMEVEFGKENPDAFTFYKLLFYLRDHSMIDSIYNDMWVISDSLIKRFYMHNIYNWSFSTIYDIDKLGIICPLICLK